MANELFNLSDDAGLLTVEFHKKSVDYLEDIKLFDESFFAAVKGRELCFKGRSPVEIYAYAVYWCIRNGCKSIQIEEFNLSQKFKIYESGADYSFVMPSWCVIDQDCEPAIASIIPPESKDRRWSEEFIKSNAFAFLIKASPKSLVFTGMGTVLFYSILACSAAISGCENVFIDKPTEKALLRVAGNMFDERSKDKPSGKMIGILGDPNSGKSVFSRVFGCLLENFGNKNVWVYDCDASAPTSDWYIYGLQRAQSEEIVKEMTEARKALKQKWTCELEQKVLSCMKNVKAKLNLVVADFPGGRHDDEKNIHERIPSKERAKMLECCDSFIIVCRIDKPELIGAWKSALRQYDLADRVRAEIFSKEPNLTPAIEDCHFDKDGIFHATVCGLSRENDREAIVSALLPEFHKVFAQHGVKL